MSSISMMTLLFTILNFAIIILLFIFIGKFIIINSLSANIKKIIVIAYCIILFAALLILNVLPNKNFIVNDNSEQKSYNNSNMELEDFKQLALEGKLSSSKQFIKKGSKNFTYKEQFLKIECSADTDVEILVQQKKEEDGQIEVTDYIGESIFSGVNFNNKLNPLIVQIDDDKLMINKKADKQINIIRTGYDVATEQFIKDKNEQEYFETPFFNMRKILIKIPQNIQIDSAYNNVEIIKKGSEKN